MPGTQTKWPRANGRRQSGFVRGPRARASKAAACTCRDRRHQPHRVGLVGLGHQGRDDHLAATQKTKLVELVAVCDRDPEVRSAVNNEFGPEGYADHRAMLDRGDLDFVIVATPHDTHASITLDALERGIPVLKEKPLALSVREGQRIVERSQETGIPVMVATQRRFDHLFSVFESALTSIGEPTLIEGRYMCCRADAQAGWRGSPHSAGGGCLMDMGYHLIDTIIRFFGLPDQLMAGTGITSDDVVEDQAMVFFNYGSATGTLITSRRYPFHGKQECLRVLGCHGAIEIRNGRFCQLSTSGAKLESVRGTDLTKARSVRMIESFSRVLAGDLPNPSDAEAHLDHLRFLEAAYLSAKTGRPYSPERIEDQP